MLLTPEKSLAAGAETMGANEEYIRSSAEHLLLVDAQTTSGAPEHAESAAAHSPAAALYEDSAILQDNYDSLFGQWQRALAWIRQLEDRLGLPPEERFEPWS